ncbi:glycoside hydrolase family 3 protein [Eubacterium xylanophilum]|uniref:glycoside hydrolase family 3 protein n=1 Tax=Eubacterium xylanophilum TaxID=39497 RepID=UPI0004BCA92A|nr:glycoside hydrolase family 3 protein [Eubacterium xylanophilum]
MVLHWEDYERVAREAIDEGCVLLKNDGVLPLLDDEKQDVRLSVFGRISEYYYRSGSGSGGLVNVHKSVGIMDALEEDSAVQVDRELREIYLKWCEENPVDMGTGWASEPLSQPEMPIDEEIVAGAASRSDAALIVVGRYAGEDRDCTDEPGAYQLLPEEVDLIQKVTANFEKSILVINAGFVIDLSHECIDQCDAILYAWQGGMLGGYGVSDVILGRVNPSGRLTDTIAKNISDYPSNENFGDVVKNYYKEDIYVGYRYFSCGEDDKVRYPFGFGLSYTSFDISEATLKVENLKDDIEIQCKVKNTGERAGKQVVQCYVKAPQGKLGKPARALIGYAKTEEIAPGQEEMVHITVDPYVFASYDETGVSGYESSYVHEAGEYVFYIGENAIDNRKFGVFCNKETTLVEKLRQELAPIEEFQRIKPVLVDGIFSGWTRENVPTGEPEDTKKRWERAEKLTEIAYTGDKGIKLDDVADGKNSIDEFIGQMSDEDLACIARGEGMGSPLVTPGTASAYGGMNAHMRELGIPCGCCSDGPSGMRIDSGSYAFSLPCGTMLACTFNDELVEKLYGYLGMEMLTKHVDNILGPGVNIHRHPLNGRNFEYFSEDPLVSGKMAAAIYRGLHKYGVTGTIKHFAANNQEKRRYDIDSVISERAVREIYLRPYEIAVKQGGADSVMTSYGKLNGGWTAGRFELNTRVLREEWGFKGIVMTDWAASISEQCGEPSKNNLHVMIGAGNNIYMVFSKAEINSNHDTTVEEIEKGGITRAELQNNAREILLQLMDMPAFKRQRGEIDSVEIQGRVTEDEDLDWEDVQYYTLGDYLKIDLSDKSTDKGASVSIGLETEKTGLYKIVFNYVSDLGPLAQTPVTIFSQNMPRGVVTFFGTEGKHESVEKTVNIVSRYSVDRFKFMQSGVKLDSIELELIESISHEFTVGDTEESDKPVESDYVFV